MPKRLIALSAALILTGCHGSHHPSTARADAPAAASDVKAGTTQDSVDPRLNALQRTKRKIGEIEAIRAKNMAQVNA
ncbi:MAG TPA: hypothetical protein V6D47_00880, partial [Oscillatoriaceae cyanobacterium]